MKILYACPTLASPTCGIGIYTRYFVEAASLLGLDVVAYGGPLIGLYDRILENQPQVVHLQFEYSFASPQRLQILATQCKKLGIKLVVTLHSVSPTAPHNWALVKEKVTVVVHSKALLSYFPNLARDVHVLPLAIPFITPSSTAITIPRKAGVTRCGFFGTCYFHKGLHNLLTFISYSAPRELLVLAGKPPHSLSYYECCKKLANSLSNVMWCDAWLSDNEIVSHLQTCDVLFFPYEEYGGSGCSAALRTAFNAEKLCYVTPTSHFSDVLAEKQLPVASTDEDFLTSKESSRRIKNANKLRTCWSFPSIVSRHVEEVYERT